jgi:phospholipid/cholesterol/gamma-HCH transport system permease protein
MKFFHLIDHAILGVGRYSINSILNMVKFLKFILAAVKQIPFIFNNFHFTLEQMHVIGTESIMLVAVTSVFTGGVGALTFLSQFGDFIPLW